MRLFFSVTLLLFALSYSLCAFPDNAKIVLATANWEPYISESEPEHGKFSQIVTAVFKEMGLETAYIFAPWKRVEAIVESGAAFAGIPYSFTQERYKTFNYSAPIMNSWYVFFYNKKAYPQGISYSKLEELARYRISGVTGYWYDELFAKAKLNVEYVTTDEQGISKLYANRVDLAATDDLVGWLLIKKLYPKESAQFGVVKQPFGSQYLHLMVSKKYPHAVELTQKFNAILKKQREQGTVPKL